MEWSLAPGWSGFWSGRRVEVEFFLWKGDTSFGGLKRMDFFLKVELAFRSERFFFFLWSLTSE